MIGWMVRNFISKEETDVLKYKNPNKDLILEFMFRPGLHCGDKTIGV